MSHVTLNLTLKKGQDFAMKSRPGIGTAWSKQGRVKVNVFLGVQHGCTSRVREGSGGGQTGHITSPPVML